ncbi:MAG: hypothetical protein LUD01_08315 [Clostridiales bacterium]|nr:hypothetical protein [Clostridiales bacterium]
MKTLEYLVFFLRNLLLNENNPLHNRIMHVSGVFKELQKVNDGAKKADIEEVKADIEEVKTDIESLFTSKTATHVLKLLTAFGCETIFGRSDVQRELDLKSSRSSALLREMAEQGIIIPVSGHGKGKYRFLLQ